MRMHKNNKYDEEYECQIDQANLIRNLNDDLMKVVINPTKDNIREFTLDLIWESTDNPNKIKKSRKYPHTKLKPFTRHIMNYKNMS